MVQQFLSDADADRAARCLGKIQGHAVQGWVLTGGLAIEIHRLTRGLESGIRVLNDIDFLVESFESLPQTLADQFLFRHIHPLDPPGKTIMQLVDIETALRVDVFRTYASVMRRAIQTAIFEKPLQIVSLEDLLARTTRILMATARAVPVASKHATDFLRLREMAKPGQVEIAWPDHRGPGDPSSFEEAASVVCDSIATRKHLLIDARLSQDPAELCDRCVQTGRFQLADPSLVLSILGYC